ncbi:MAG: HD domain-containing protein [Candidatus Thorarchaeota archaeon]|jgi:GTP pyrophosphokinase
MNAAKLAAQLHYGQKRHSGLPYIYHPLRVAGMALAYGLPPAIVDAAWLHDVYEDTRLLPGDLVNIYGVHLYTESTVVDLTSVYTKERYPDMSRADRKKNERERLAACPEKSQSLKLFDRMDNLQTIEEKGKKFAELYRGESALLVDALVGAPEELRVAAHAMIQNPGFVPELYL